MIHRSQFYSFLAETFTSKADDHRRAGKRSSLAQQRLLPHELRGQHDEHQQHAVEEQDEAAVEHG